MIDTLLGEAVRTWAGAGTRLRTGLGSRFSAARKGGVHRRVAGVVDRIPSLAAPPLYNLTVCDEPAFVWYRVAKVGTRTIHGHLSAHARLRLDQPYQVPIPRSARDRHFHFAFVRNPWDRLVSCWQQKVLKTDHFDLGAQREGLRSFRAFVDWVARHELSSCDPHIRIQATLIGLGSIDFLGRFEQFEDDLTAVCRRLGLPDCFGHRNPTAHDHYSRYYDDSTAEAVGRLYEPDVRLFGYTFERVVGPDRSGEAV